MAAEAPAVSSDRNQTWDSPWLDFNASRSSLPPSSEKEQASFLSEIGVENFITLIAFGLIFTLGVMGNSLVITVLARSKPGKPRSTTNIFVLNLSIADLAYLLFCIPFQSTVYMMPNWSLGTFICKFIHYFFTISMLVSIFTLSAMSVDRYVAIVHSRRSSSVRVSRNALLGVGVIWLLSIAMASPVAHHQRIVHEKFLNQTFCWEVWPNLQHKKVYVLCTFIFGYLLPLLLISFCYAKKCSFTETTISTYLKESLHSQLLKNPRTLHYRLIWKLSEIVLCQVLNHLHKKLRNISKKSEASKKKTAQTVLVVVVVFGISWLPHHVIHLWAEFGDFPLTQASFFFRITAHCLAYSNSSVNPIIYAFLSENFRKAYKQVFECQIGHNSPLNEVKDNKSNIDTPPFTNSTHV